MATYRNITADEMSAFLCVRGFQQVCIPDTVELVFEKPVQYPGSSGRPLIGLVLRVYTGINPNGQSRAVGKDAIRVCFFWDNKIIGASKRVHRVQGWRKNLDDRLSNWKELLGPYCPRCGGLMVERHARKNKKYSFWGCMNYPTCNGFQPKN